MVNEEKQALEFFSQSRIPHGRFPRLIHFGPWNQDLVLVAEMLPLPGAGREELQDLHVRFLLEVAAADRRRQKFADSAFFSTLLEGLQQVRSSAPEYQLRLVDKAVAELRSRLGPVQLPFVWRLGSFAPRQVGIEPRTARILVPDLRQASALCIPGWDLMHFLARSRRGLRGRPQAGSASLPGVARGYFQSLGIEPGLVPWLQVAYLADLWLSSERQWDGAGLQKPPEVLRVLRETSRLLFVRLEDARSGGAG